MNGQLEEFKYLFENEKAFKRYILDAEKVLIRNTGYHPLAMYGVEETKQRAKDLFDFYEGKNIQKNF